VTYPVIILAYWFIDEQSEEKNQYVQNSAGFLYRAISTANAKVILIILKAILLSRLYLYQSPTEYVTAQHLAFMIYIYILFWSGHPIPLLFLFTIWLVSLPTVVTLCSYIFCILFFFFYFYIHVFLLYKKPKQWLQPGIS
jgi:hypothetical protein